MTHADPLAVLHAPLGSVRDGLEEAQALLEQGKGDAMHDLISELDRRAVLLYQRLEACRRYLSIQRKSIHAPYNPAQLIKSQSGFTPMPVGSLPAKPLPMLEGDATQILDVLRVIWTNAAPGNDGQVTTALYVEGEGPRFAIGIAGQGAFPERYDIGDGLALDAAELDERWHDATKGGYINQEDQHLTLLLTGEEYAPAPAPELEQQAGHLERATRALMPWRSAGGFYEEGLVHPDDTRRLYAQSFTEAIEAITAVLATPSGLTA